MDNDISKILDDWPYDEEANVRKISTRDGRVKLQVRLQMGIEQYETRGRPDGRLINGHHSYLDYYQALAEEQGVSWRLSEEQFKNLYEESLLYYNRYLLFFKIGDYDLCARDTARNIKLADFVLKRAENKETATLIEQYRPYMLRMQAVSLSVKSAKKGKFREALQDLDRAINEIKKLCSIDSSIFRLEKTRSLITLRDLKQQIMSQRKTQTPDIEVEDIIHKPESRVELLEKQLSEAISDENYELAAELRDRINSLNREESYGD